MKDFVSSHTKTERILHDLAFKSWYPRISLSNIESQLYKNQLAAVSVERPVFITALPRAGTTLILELCVGINEFASHTYSDMPFLLTPLLWNRFSTRFRNTGNLSERVHGDGIMVNVNSPESFEEIIWKEFWPSRYKKNRIVPWTDSNYPDFEAFFNDHMHKIILLRSNEEKQVRYISKNNLNIARIGYLSSAFSDSTILILFRSPLQHAASLLKQHRNFLRIHNEDSFAKKYMEDTGHFDFGENLRPVDFNGWLSEEPGSDTNTITFWLQYWINTYRYLMRNKNDRVRFFSYDSLCKYPQSGLERLGGILEVRNIGLLEENIERITTPKLHIVDINEIAPNILEQAEEIYLDLKNIESI